MPCSLVHQNGVLYCALTGSVVDADMATLAEFVMKEEWNSKIVPHRIIDFTGAITVKIGFDTITGLARQRMTHAISNPLKSAIVAPQSKLRFLARMFQALNRHPMVTVRVFRELEQAWAWLAED